ncbi:hypothetical protein [Streptomyces griseoflavus]|uniref:hypothetical protein n=1 Tax=Streptomyces griseoflavus TaxID=35619 RepID=UPI0001B4DBFC|nr:hypothetical protein [Streptomyces griseoflavus]
MIRSGFQKLGRPIPSFGPECKTRKLSDDELRKRREYVDAYREARDKKQVPPRPPWVNPEADHDLIERIREGRAQQALERHTTDVREGYGDTVPEFEEME